MMRLNSSTKIISSKIVLVPYRISHVEKYHKWMESEELRKQTASQRLSLSEEYDMQQTWLKDEEKCTFIVLDRKTLETSGCENESMIGDANIYLTKTSKGISGEIGLMIAERTFRERGYGKETLLCLLYYGIKTLNINKFVAIISLDNIRSIEMFKKFDFRKESESSVFNEVTLVKHIDESYSATIRNSLETYIETCTEENK